MKEVKLYFFVFLSMIFYSNISFAGTCKVSVEDFCNKKDTALLLILETGSLHKHKEYRQFIDGRLFGSKTEFLKITKPNIFDKSAYQGFSRYLTSKKNLSEKLLDISFKSEFWTSKYLNKEKSFYINEIIRDIKVLRKIKGIDKNTSKKLLRELGNSIKKRSFIPYGSKGLYVLDVKDKFDFLAKKEILIYDDKKISIAPVLNEKFKSHIKEKYFHDENPMNNGDAILLEDTNGNFESNENKLLDLRMKDAYTQGANGHSQIELIERANYANAQSRE